MAVLFQKLRAVVWLLGAYVFGTDLPRDHRGPKTAANRQVGPGDRGDVPGWVMITVMSAALVVALLVPFRTAIVDAVTSALADVTGAAG